MTQDKVPHTNNKTPKGYSFELVVALIIVIALITFLVPTYYKYIDVAKVTIAKNTVVSIQEALESYKLLHKEYPTSINLLTGRDAFGNVVFQDELVSLFGDSFFSIESYKGSSDSYTLIIKVSDKEQTIIKLIPSRISE